LSNLQNVGPVDPTQQHDVHSVCYYKLPFIIMRLLLFASCVPVNSDTSSATPHPHNPTSLLPAPLTGRPQPFHLALASPWTGNTAQAPHRRTQRDIPIPPINSMPLPGKREPDKRAGGLLIRRTHRRGTPKFCSSQLGGTQSRGEHHRAARLRESVPTGCVPHAQGGVREPQRTSRTPPRPPGEPSSRLWGLAGPRQDRCLY